MDIFDHIIDGRITIIVKPNAPKTKIKSWDKEKNALIVEVKAHPENNKANIEIIKFFTRLTKKKVRFVSGMTSKKKILRFD